MSPQITVHVLSLVRHNMGRIFFWIIPVLTFCVGIILSIQVSANVKRLTTRELRRGNEGEREKKTKPSLIEQFYLDLRTKVFGEVSG